MNKEKRGNPVIRAIRAIGIALAGLLVLGAIAFILWAETPAGPGPDALAALESGNGVTVSRVGSWTEFAPSGATLKAPDTAFVFYPGGRVDWRSYAVPLRQLAERGYLAIIVPVRLNLAFFDIDAATPAIAAHPEIRKWAVGGHSLGGVAASLYAGRHPDSVDALVFWASFPSDGALAQGSMPVLSLSASNDGLSTPEKIDASRALLPPSASFVVIQGGNHGGFGDYGPQKGDKPAAIPKEEQWREIARATAAFLAGLPR